MSAALSEANVEDTLSEIQNAQQLRQHSKAIESKIVDCHAEVAEFDRAASALGQVEPSTTCFRLVGNVLVERVAGDVIPELNDQKTKLLELIKSLEAQREKQETEANRIMNKHREFLEILGKRRAEQQMQQQQQMQQMNSSR